MAQSGRWQGAWRYLLMAVVLLLILLPIYWMVTISLKTPKEIYRVPSLFPVNPTLENYRQLLLDRGFLTNIRNSLIVASSVTVTSVLVSLLAAYSLVRLKYRFRTLIGRMILLAYLTPGSLLFVPLSVIVAKLNLGNTLHGLVFVYLAFAVPMSTWLLMGYLRSVPVDIEEAALVDGLNRIGTLVRILLPISAPGIVAVCIFTFTGAWNELLLALIFISTKTKMTVPVGLQYLITGDVFLWGPIMAGAVLSALPMMILYFLAQRFMVDGLGSGAVKG